MIKKLGNKGLFLILILLLAAFAVFRYINNKRGENTFKTAIIPKIDTARLNGMIIFPRIEKTGKPLPYVFTKKGDIWYVSQGDATSLATPRSAHYMITQLEQISPDRLGSNDPKDWKQYNVNDSLGTRVVLLYDKDTALDLVVGRFSYIPQQRQAISYVRLYGHTDVYAIDGFISMNIASDFNDWRDKKIMPGDDYSTWTKLTFTYPADSGFVIEKDSSNKWIFSDGSKPDLLSTTNIIKDINNQNYGVFINKFDTTGKQAPFTLKIEGSNFSPVLVKAYPADTINKYAISSTLNPGSFFSGKANNMFNTIFPAKAAFFKKTEKKRENLSFKGEEQNKILLSFQKSLRSQ